MVLTEFDEEKYEEMIRNEERIKTLCPSWGCKET